MAESLASWLRPDLKGDDRGLSHELEAGLRAAVLQGRLPPDSRVPSSRALAEELGVSRNTVLHAYEQLLAEGYFESRRGAGTFVAREIGAPPPERRAGLPRRQQPVRLSAAAARIDELRLGAHYQAMAELAP